MKTKHPEWATKFSTNYLKDWSGTPTTALIYFQKKQAYFFFLKENKNPTSSISILM